MKFKPIDHTKLLPFEPYLFKIVSAGVTVYTVGVMDNYNGYKLQKYQYLADQITDYAEIQNHD